jgi:hypothetical protein
VSAASGLIRVANRLYVVADDELHLGVFPATGGDPGELLRMLPGELPLKPKQRKRSKPDFEALLHLPAFGDYPQGALLALGSGSTTRRYRGALLPLNAKDAIDIDRLRVLDLMHLYTAVEREVGTVNIEGAVATHDRLWLMQRGNKGDGINAIMGFDLREFCSDVERSDVLSAPATQAVHRCDLGAIRDVPLGFSDGAALSDGSIVFSAIAEDTNDAYADGPFAGAAIGIIDSHGSLLRITHVHERAKIEGVFAHADRSSVHLLLVTDADDADVPSVLYSAKLQL